ncbi:glycosyl transferase [Solibacillus silvestris]|nr:glycosyltransferase family 4 protein [Solibacillus silvestris]OBW58439.1 glycosyl transferase [Solibacillus silvestris]
MARILILANNDGGLYKFRKELIEELVKMNEVIVSLPNGEYIPKVKELGCHFIDTPINRRGTNLMTDFKLFQNYKKIIKGVKPDVILTYTIKPNVYGGLTCKALKIPYIANITGLGTAVESGGLLQKITLSLYKSALMKSNCVFFQNEINRKYFVEKGIVKSKTRLIPGSGVNIDQHKLEEYPNSDEIIKFLFVGRIMKAKGIDELLKAAQIVKKKFQNIQFHLIGECEEQKYNQQLDTLAKQNIIYYHGQQSDIHSFLKESHAIVHPSYHEGLSNVLLESASSGRPILASNVPGCIETFDEGISGYGFNVKSVDSLVETIIKFIELPLEQKRKMGILGRKKIEKEFNRKFVIDAYLEEIHNVTRGENIK